MWQKVGKWLLQAIIEEVVRDMQAKGTTSGDLSSIVAQVASQVGK